MRRFLLLGLSVIVGLACVAQVSQSLLAEYVKLQIHTALVVPSTGIDDSPLWSPDSRFLGVNIQGRWSQIDTTQLTLKAAVWHKLRIGIVSSQIAISPLDPGLIVEWTRATRSDSTVVADDSGTKIEFVRKNLGTSLVVTQKGRKARALWRSDLESCKELALSPNGQWVAFICEENGVFITNLARVRG